ncbi:elongation factor G [Phytomonospora endophytica]|uniref:Ribosomal protection tetracycline resistance protein n=1 Tax=Phytomonospora endophytica TaxID=714109 RepID=A0A841FAW9_9ACTN|nr:TetM/TetW/TetO/TetS family tetracycline resistance ribosomal protection protein [Phytomonospora endophytica]MBB6034411.1 ribosomal protection tetracycline resistance protein [Phytomonospora endophytica]GIG66805.1 tetracycline resistance protein [Phytomonospora endophytica]
MKQLNIGIVAHVDAGKTSLTERLLHTTGVIDHVGSVDGGDTQTDSLDLERRRGITIQSAVVSFHIGDLKVNLIDTPGHSDFIAEVARAMHVLDGAVLVVSAVEGVQAQTRVLMRTLARLRIPTLIFVNKIDRRGARHGELLAEMRRKLKADLVALSTVDGLGTREVTSAPRSFRDPELYAEIADALSAHDEEFLSGYVESRPTSPGARRAALARATRRALAQPVFFGSAVTGEGVDALIDGIRRYLPHRLPHGTRPRGSVFKIKRGPAGEKIAYVRLREGTLRAPARLRLYRADGDGHVTANTAKVTAVQVFTDGAATVPGEVRAGGIAKVWGLRDALIGDAVGSPGELPPKGLFAPPTLETVVSPVRPEERGRLFQALRDLSERDPFINVRGAEDITVSLYGEVQKEVITSMLAERFGLDVTFAETRTVHVERPSGSAEAAQEIGGGFFIYLGLRLEPGEKGSGVVYRMEAVRGNLLAGYHTAVEETVRETLREGHYGWRVTDCVVTLLRGGYITGKTTGQFRDMTAALVRRTLAETGTYVCAPVHRFELEAPEASAAGILIALTDAGAELRSQETARGVCHLTGTISAKAVHAFERRLPGLSSGEAVFTSTLDGYRRVYGEPPRRAGTGRALTR